MLLLSTAWAAAVSAFPDTAQAQSRPTGAEVRGAILRSIEAFRTSQKPDGTWPDYAQEGGVTALAAYALLQAGVTPEDKALARALQQIEKTAHQSTYVVSLKALALASADPKKYREAIQACADWLVAIQNAGGGWGYGRVPAAPLSGEGAAGLVKNEAALKRAYERPDLSNTQFAILALSEAERAGAKVPPDVWRKADRYVRTSQLPGGGWGYVYHDADPEEAYGSMTAAAVASVFLCADRLARQDEPAETTRERLTSAQMGLVWIADHYTLKENPARGLAWYYFWLYAVERAGVTSGWRQFGDHDWFREGAAMLVDGQRADGAWTDRPYENALCLLFLAKGYKPVLVQRLVWEGPWRKDPRDLDHLVRFLDRRLGGQAVAWQTLRSEAPLDQWMAAPLLQVTGRGQLRMLAGPLARLRQYVEQGGLIVFDAEGGDAAFVQSVRDLLAEQFPESKLEPLPADHPLAAAVHKVKPAGLEVMNVGCRAAVVLATKGLADAMASEDPSPQPSPPNGGEGGRRPGEGAPAARPPEALRLGENLAVYATGAAALPDRLQPAVLIEMPRDEKLPADAYRLGQIQHDGDWNPRPYAVPKLLKELATRFGVAVYSRPAPLRLTDPDLGKYPILYLTGHYAFHLTEAERAALRDYLDRGGVVWAEACCGRPAFDKSLRDLMKELFPDSPLEELPADSPIYSGKVGSAIGTVAYSPAVQAESPKLNRPVLLGLSRHNHLALVYSPYGLAVGLDGLKTYGARCLSPDDASRLAVNLLLYLMH
jgi:hypothetical protein